MKEINLIKDSAFLSQLNKYNNKTYYAKIIILNNKGLPLTSIEGKISGGNINVDGSSNIRRAGSITFVTNEIENDLTRVDYLLSFNKLIKVMIGLENDIDVNYDDIIWFNQGVFVIIDPSISHSTSGITISLNLKDKMCLLNGEMGGNLPTSVTFDSYDQYIGMLEVQSIIPQNNRFIPDLPKDVEPNKYTVYKYQDKQQKQEYYYMYNPSNGVWTEDKSYKNLINSVESIQNNFFDIIQTAVCNYGGEPIENIFIHDVPRELKQLVRNTSSSNMYYNEENSVYSFQLEGDPNDLHRFRYNEDVGYVFTEFTYPDELVTSIGDNVCSVLDKVIEKLGNYEYFYDIDGHFVFQEKKNYLNTSYDPVYKKDSEGNITKILDTEKGLINTDNYYVDFNNTSQSLITFDKDTTLISAYSNNPKYSNIKNDFHVWGQNSGGKVLHYHLAIKEKPVKDFYQYSNGSIEYGYPERKVIYLKDKNKEYTGQIRLATKDDSEYVYYIPTDWRVELYLQGLEAQISQRRPDMYQQELLDLFDSIYNMREQKYKVDLVSNPNDLLYFIDFLEPDNNLLDISVDSIGTKIYSYQQDNIRRLYDGYVPDVLILNIEDSTDEFRQKYINLGYTTANVTNEIYQNLSIGTVGYTAHETIRNLLYQYTNYNETISLNSIPIYYLEPNNRITVYDTASGIKGDYVINSFSISFTAEMMNINASKVIDRI